MRGWPLVLGLGLLGSAACFGCDSGDSGNAKSVVGPGVDVHCQGQGRHLDQPGIGDTNVKVTCPPTELPQ
jgi:hypothetical protein